MPGKRRITFVVSVASLAVIAAFVSEGKLADAAARYKAVAGWGQLTAPLKWGGSSERRN